MNLMKMFRRRTAPSKPPERNHCGARVDPVCVAHSCRRLEEFLKLYPGSGPGIDRIISSLMIERELGLSDLRKPELREVLDYLRQKI
jgi:hypothetical protein